MKTKRLLLKALCVLILALDESASADSISSSTAGAGRVSDSTFFNNTSSDGLTLQTIFHGADPGGNPATTNSFNPTLPDGFYIQVNDSTTVYFMNPNKNTSDSKYLQINFLGAHAHRLEADDLAEGPIGGRDYNDMAITVPSSPVPEPGSLVLLGSGLLSAAGLTRKKLLGRS